MDADVEPGAAFVERTGIALVHEGELIVPAPGAEAGLTAAGVERLDAPGEVHYWFPVQIEVVGLDDETAGGVVARVFDELQQELASWG